MNLRIRRFLSALLVVVTVLALVGQSALATSISCYVNANTKVYKKASTSSVSLKVSKGLKVTMTAYNGSWARITRNGATAYIPLKYLTLTNRLTAYTAKNTSMYKSASSSSKKLGTIPKGTTVYINGRDGSYYRVQNKSGSITGYVRASDLTSTKPKSSSNSSSNSSSTPRFSSSMSSSEKAAYVAAVAKSLLGRPYSSSPSAPKSFDCSRFVKYCFAQAKVSVPGSAQSQGYDSGYTRITSTGSLKKGDIVCFNTNASDDDLCDHTGIYIGDGYFIHASSAAGKVITSSLSSGYYKKTFSWGLRVFG